MISRAQKYKIKSKMPYKLPQKALSTYITSIFLVKKTKINRLSQLPEDLNRSKQGTKQTGKG